MRCKHLFPKRETSRPPIAFPALAIAPFYFSDPASALANLLTCCLVTAGVTLYFQKRYLSGALMLGLSLGIRLTTFLCPR